MEECCKESERCRGISYCRQSSPQCLTIFNLLITRKDYIGLKKISPGIVLKIPHFWHQKCFYARGLPEFKIFTTGGGSQLSNLLAAAAAAAIMSSVNKIVFLSNWCKLLMCWMMAYWKADKSSSRDVSLTSNTSAVNGVSVVTLSAHSASAPVNVAGAPTASQVMPTPPHTVSTTNTNAAMAMDLFSPARECKCHLCVVFFVYVTWLSFWCISSGSSSSLEQTGWPQTWKTWNTQGFLRTWKTQGILCNLGKKL